MDKNQSGEAMKSVLLDAVDGANLAEETLRIARDMVNNHIGGEGADVDELVAIACVLDRVKSQIDKSIAGIEAIRKA